MFFWVDGNCTGLALSAVMKESSTDPSKLARFSDNINKGRQVVVEYVNSIGAKLIFASGDDVFFEAHTFIDENKIKNIYLSVSGQTCSISSGKTIKETLDNMTKTKACAHGKIKYD